MIWIFQDFSWEKLMRSTAWTDLWIRKECSAGWQLQMSKWFFNVVSVIQCLTWESWNGICEVWGMVYTSRFELVSKCQWRLAFMISKLMRHFYTFFQCRWSFMCKLEQRLSPLWFNRITHFQRTYFLLFYLKSTLPF